MADILRELCVQDSQAGSAALRAGVRRELLQVGVITVVTTTQELQQAVMAGKLHIEVLAHLDLTSLELICGEVEFPSASCNDGLGQWLKFAGQHQKLSKEHWGAPSL